MDASAGTSMISLIIPPKDQINRVTRMLADEYGTASNIKSRVNRLSVLSAITSTQQRLKLYTKGRVCCTMTRNQLIIYLTVYLFFISTTQWIGSLLWYDYHR
jgi:peptide subunit release factor 1 (eRF1)